MKLPAFAGTAWKQPRQLWLRKAFFQVHLWCGIFLALYVIAIGISGSILVFKDELDWRPHTGRMAFDPGACTPDRLTNAMHSARKQHPNLSASVATCPIEANPFYLITLQPATADAAPGESVTMFIDPTIGSVAGESRRETEWIAAVERFHFDLLLKKNGRQWNGAAAAILFALVVTGIVLWWPGVRNWSRAFKIDFRRTWKRINFDMHSALGIWTVVFTFTWAATGIYFAWPTPVEHAINAVSPILTANYPEEELQRIAARSPSRQTATLNLNSVLLEACRISPGEHLEGFFFGSRPNALLTVYMAREHLGDYTKTDFLYFDQRNGEHLLTWRRGQNKTPGDWILWLLVPLHFGTSWGVAGKIIWSLMGLALPVLAVTGLLMYWNRWLGKVSLRSSWRDRTPKRPRS